MAGAATAEATAAVSAATAVVSAATAATATATAATAKAAAAAAAAETPMATAGEEKAPLWLKVRISLGTKSLELCVSPRCNTTVVMLAVWAAREEKFTAVGADRYCAAYALATARDKTYLVAGKPIGSVLRSYIVDDTLDLTVVHPSFTRAYNFDWDALTVLDPVSLEPADLDDMVMLPCRHLLGLSGLQAWRDATGKHECPTCREPFTTWSTPDEWYLCTATVGYDTGACGGRPRQSGEAARAPERSGPTTEEAVVRFRYFTSTTMRRPWISALVDFLEGAPCACACDPEKPSRMAVVNTLSAQQVGHVRPHGCEVQPRGAIVVDGLTVVPCPHITTIDNEFGLRYEKARTESARALPAPAVAEK